MKKAISILLILVLAFGIQIGNVAMAAMSSEFYNASTLYEQNFHEITTEGGNMNAIDNWSLYAAYNTGVGIANSTATADSTFGKDGTSWGVRLTAPSTAGAATTAERPGLKRAFVTPAITSGVVSYQFDYKIVGSRNISVALGNNAVAALNLNQTSFQVINRTAVDNQTDLTVTLKTTTASTWYTVRVDTQINKNDPLYSRNYIYLNGEYLGSYLTRKTTATNSLNEIAFTGGYGTAAIDAYIDNVKVTKSDVLEVTLLDEIFNDGLKPSSISLGMNSGTASYPDGYSGNMSKALKMDATGATANSTLTAIVPKNTNMNNGILSVSFDYFIDSIGTSIFLRGSTVPDTTTTPLTEVLHAQLTNDASFKGSITTLTNKSGGTTLTGVSNLPANTWRNVRFDTSLNSTDGWGKVKAYVNGVYRGESDTRNVAGAVYTPTNQSYYRIYMEFVDEKVSYIDNLKVVYKEFASAASGVGSAKPDDAKNYDYQLYFKNGSNTITTLQAGNITGYVTTNKNDALNVIAALYDNNNAMKDIKVLTSGNFSSTTFSDSSFNFSNVLATDKIQIFAFKNLTNILPRAAKREFSSTGLH